MIFNIFIALVAFQIFWIIFASKMYPDRMADIMVHFQNILRRYEKGEMKEFEDLGDISELRRMFAFCGPLFYAFFEGCNICSKIKTKLRGK